MGQKGTDVAVIYNNDAAVWVNYIKNHLQKIDQGKDPMMISSYEDSDLFPRPHRQTKTSLESALVIVVIASPGFLDMLQCDEKRKFIIKDPSNAILFLCGTTEADIKRSCLDPRFNNYDAWKKIMHGQPEDLFRCITANIDSVDSKPLVSTKRVVSVPDEDEDEDIPEGEVGSACGGGASVAPTSSVDAKWAFDITPSVIHSEEQTEIVIFFHNKLPDNCQLRVVFDDMRLPVLRRNPYTFCFIAPEHEEGDVQVMLECDEGKVGDLTLKYKCEMEKMNGLIQIHLQALELTCQQKGPSSKELDKTLSNIFMDKGDMIPAAAFETLFGMHEYAASTSIKHELPTLLHFAAKYGLKDFTCHLIDLPGALLAYSISNKNDDRPAEIARNHEHIELANYFDSYIEMNGALYELMEPYMYFSIEAPRYNEESNYYNQPGYVGYERAIPVGTAPDDMYVDMTGNPDAPGYIPMNRITRKAPKPTLVPKTPRQKELYDIMMQLYETKITALEIKRHITEWFSKHASGTSLKDKQMKLDELKEEVQKWVVRDREDAGYVTTHSNKGEFVQYMLRQCMRLHTSPYYNTKTHVGGNQDDPSQQTNEPEAEYLYTAEMGDAAFSPSAPPPRRSQSQETPGSQRASGMQRTRPVSMRMDKLIQNKGIEPVPPLPRREVLQRRSQLQDKPVKPPSVSSPTQPDIPQRMLRTRLS